MRHYYNFYLILLFLFLISCNDPHEYLVDDEFTQYVAQFELQAELHGKTIDTETTGLIVEFADLKDNQAGLCHYEKPVRIQIDRSYWQAVSKSQNAELMKEELLFHELGHGILGRSHTNSTLENGDWKSVMCGGDKVSDRSWNINYRGIRRKYYIDELFNENIAEPDFARLQLKTDTSGFYSNVFLNFNTNKPSDTGWEETNNNSYNINFVNQQLQFTSKISSSAILLIKTAVNILSDFILDCDIQCQSADNKNQYGITFGNNNNNEENLEYFCINNVQKMYMGNRKCYSYFTEITKKEILPNKFNHLKIIKTENMLYYFINDIYVYCSEPDPGIQGNQFGFFVPGKAIVRIDNFRIATRNIAGMNVKSAGIQKSDFTFSPVNEIKCDLMK